MWIYVPDEGEREPWVGKLSTDESPKSPWRFELIRHAAQSDLYRESPFDRNTVIGLLNHERRCTLIRPLVERIDPGSVGIGIFQRTIIEGSIGALLTDVAVTDGEDRIFKSIRFESDAFSAWYSPPAYTTGFDAETRTPSVQIGDTRRDEFDVASLGQVRCTTGISISSGLRSRVLKSSSVFTVDFKADRSLDDIMLLCFGFERLFGFLIGFRGRPPSFTLRTNRTLDAGEHSLPEEGVLEIGGMDWKEGVAPHPMQCIHRNDAGSATLQLILQRFLADRESLVTRIHAVEFSRFFSRDLSDRFSVVMPILESYLKKKFTEDDEVSYISHEEKFFDWIDSSNNDEIKEFSKKHINVKNRKSPSLTTLLLRGIKFVNTAGYLFPEEMAGRIQKRRGAAFHSQPHMSQEDVRMFYEEIRAATGLLMLHTLADLGIDISLIRSGHSMPDLREFLPRQTPLIGRSPSRAGQIAERKTNKETKRTTRRAKKMHSTKAEKLRVRKAKAARKAST
jgi:hypothetical protein